MTTAVSGGAAPPPPPPPPPADTTAPAVSLTAPANGATVSGSAVTVSATASDDTAVSGVQFRLDGAALGTEDTTAPYTTTWNTTTATNASHTLTAVARDAATNTTTSTPVTVTVDNTAPPAPPAPPPPPPPPSTNLVAAYGFEEAAGTSALDSSGLANTATLNGPARTPLGRFGSALAFDGLNDWVTAPDTPALDLTTGMTLEAWIHPTTSSGWRTAIMKEQTARLVYAVYAGQGVNRPGAYLLTGGTDKGVNGSAALPVNTWTHVATTYDGVTLRVFVNGVQVGSRAVAGAMPASASPLRIGGNAVWGEWFTGRLDEIRVYNRARTAAEIQGDMARAVP